MSGKKEEKSIETIKQDAHSDKEFQQDLKAHAVSDANHDLGDSFKSIYTAFKNVGTPQGDHAAKIINSGWDVVKMFIEDADGKEIKDPKARWTPEKEKDIKIDSFRTKEPAQYN